MAPHRNKKLQKGRGIGADFKKLKHKVGRKLAPPSNATKVDVKSKAIVLSGQSVGQEKEGLSINNRRLALKELLMQTTHHNDTVRKGSLLGIKDLISRHPKELSLHAVTLVEKLCPRISDNSKAVRQALLELLRTTIFPGLPEVLMRPLIPVMMAYIFSAMTNLAADVRMSAFRFLDSVISSYPTLITADYSTQIIESFVDFLSKLGIAGQTRGQLPEMLSILLQFLSAYCKRSGQSKLTLSPTVKESQMLKNLTSLENHDVPLLALHCYKSVVPEGTSSSRVHGGKSINEDFPLHKAEALVKALFNCWAECAPLVVSGQSPDKDSIECMIKVCTALRLLMITLEPSLERKLHGDNYTQESLMQMEHSKFGSKGAIVQKWIGEQIVPVLQRHCLGSFPICAPPINLPKKVEELLLYLNISILDVTLVSIIAGDPQNHKDNCSISRLFDYFEDALDGQMLSALGLSLESVDSRIVDSYLRLLVPFVPFLLDFISKERQLRLLQAFTNVFKRCEPTSKLKHICLSCIAKILQPSDSSKGKVGQENLQEIIFDFQKQWLQMLPRLLWELKESHHASSLAILKVLHHFGRIGSQESPLAREFMALQPLMIPFFSTAQLSKLGQEQRKHGPFMRLPSDCQNLAIDLLYYYDRFLNAFLKAITHCLCPDLEIMAVVRCIEVMRAVYTRGSMDLPSYLSFILTVALEAVPLQGDCKHPSLVADVKIDQGLLYKRQRIITGALCSSLHQIGDQRLVLHLLYPSICSLMGSSLPTWTSYALVRIICTLGTLENCLFVPKSLFELLPAFLETYLISLIMECCFKERSIYGSDFLIGPFIGPCLRILANSIKVTERVLHQLCSPSRDGLSNNIYERVAVLILVLGKASVRSRRLLDSSLLQRFEGDHWLDLFQLEENVVLSIFQSISQSLTAVHGLDKAVNQNAEADII